MRRYALMLAGLAAVAGCRDDRGREVAVDRSLEHDLELPADTSAPAPVADTAHEAAMPRPTPVKAADKPKRDSTSTRVTATRPARKSARPRPAATAEADSAVGYEPPTRDTVRPARASNDSLTGTRAPEDAAASDESPASVATRTPPASPTPVRPPPRADSTPAPIPDVASPPAASLDTARPQPDTSRVPDSASTSASAVPPTPAPSTASVPVPTTNSADAGTLPAGTEIRAMLEDSLSSRRNTAGQQVQATVNGDVRAPAGNVLIPSGAQVWLSVKRLAPARSRNAKDGVLEFTVDSISAGGRALPVSAAVQPVPHELVGRGVTAGEAEKVAAGAAVGAVAGRVIGGNTKGAVIGGVVGAVGGTAVAVQTASRDVVVKTGTPIVLVLTTPLTP